MLPFVAIRTHTRDVGVNLGDAPAVYEGDDLGMEANQNTSDSAGNNNKPVLIPSVCLSISLSLYLWLVYLQLSR